MDLLSGTRGRRTSDRLPRTPARLALATLGMILGACAAAPLQLYEGDPRPVSDVAILRATGPATFLSIDHRKVDRLETHFAVLPGDHVVEFSVHRTMNVSWFDGEWRLRCALELETEAGHAYAIRSWVKQGATKGDAEFIVEVVDDATSRKWTPRCRDDERA